MSDLKDKKVSRIKQEGERASGKVEIQESLLSWEVVQNKEQGGNSEQLIAFNLENAKMVLKMLS